MKDNEILKLYKTKTMREVAKIAGKSIHVSSAKIRKLNGYSKRTAKTENIINTIRVLSEQGHSNKTIARKLGKHVNSVFYYKKKIKELDKVTS